MIFFFISKIVGFILYNLPNTHSKNSNIQQLSLLKFNLNNINNNNNNNNNNNINNNINNNNFNLDITKIKCLKENCKNQVLFLLNKKIKVYIHIEQLIQNTNIYHIGVSFNGIFDSIRYDLRGYNSIFYYNFLKKNLKDYNYFWGYTDKSLHEIKDYEISLKYKYILGIYDCRHYVRNLTQWSTSNPTPIWRLHQLIKKIEPI